MLFLSLGGCAMGSKGSIPEKEAVAASVNLDLDVLKEIDEVIEQGIKDHVTPGAVVIIGIPGKVVFKKAYGTLTYEADSTPMQLDTIFGLASISKVVGTATATMLLIQDGKLTLEDPVRNFVPGYDTEDKKDITIYHLLNHTSGLPAYCTASKVKEAEEPNLSKHENLIRYISRLPLKYETGKGYTYSCLNFLTLAYINQKILGYNQDKFLRERIYGPLGMKDTTYYLTEEQKRRTAPTIKSESEFRQGEVHDPLAYYSVSEEYAPGNAGLFSTAPDLAKYCCMILQKGTYNGKEIFTPGTVQLMTTKQVPEGVDINRALAFGIHEDFPWATSLNQKRGHEVVGHTGYTGTYIRIDKYARNYLVLLTNRVYPDDSGKVTPLRKAVIRLLVESNPLYKDVIPEKEDEEKE